MSDLNRKRIAASIPGGTWRDWDPALVAECHQVVSGRGYSSIYGRMEWDRPSPTSRRSSLASGTGGCHPDQDRALSLREGALLQGFPKDYQFVAPGKEVSIKAVGRLIGNAVPVKLARAVAGAVARHLKEFA